MGRNERLYRIDDLLQGGRCRSTGFLRCCRFRATAKRDIEYLRDRLGAPIVWDREIAPMRWEMIRLRATCGPPMGHNDDETTEATIGRGCSWLPHASFTATQRDLWGGSANGSYAI